MRKTIDIVNNRVAARDAAGAAATANAGDDALEQIHALMHAVRSRQHRALRDGPHDITPMDAKVLGFFGRNPRATQSDLAQHSGRDKAQLARLIKGLRDRGLLIAEPDAVDRRQVRLALSAEGLALQRTLTREARRVGALALVGFTQAERRQLGELLARLRSNLDADD